MNEWQSVRGVTEKPRALHSCAARVDRKHSLASARAARKLVLSMKRQRRVKTRDTSKGGSTLAPSSQCRGFEIGPTEIDRDNEIDPLTALRSSFIARA